MGTRSRIVIRRKRSEDIYLWQHWDGYLEGVGKDICEEMRRLLDKYTAKDLQEMIEKLSGLDVMNLEKYSTEELKQMMNSIDPEYLSNQEMEEGELRVELEMELEKRRNFTTSMLSDVITGRENVLFDSCDDIEYEYVIDCENECIKVNDELTVSFEALKNGGVFTDFVK
jgi:hypothetical protein